VAQVLIQDEGQTRDLVLPDSRDAWTARREATEQLHLLFEKRVRSDVLPLVHDFWQVDLPHIIGTQLVRYQTGGHYVPHTDNDDGELANRYLTVLCYLNDNFEGGGTDFPSIGFRMKPSAGTAVVFPSRFWHCAEPVISGEKLVLLTWLCGPPPLRWI
jgi:predicted 2-oxoglutarate/Fe(II)-dependent dioxygenase YbiX